MGLQCFVLSGNAQDMGKNLDSEPNQTMEIDQGEKSSKNLGKIVVGGKNFTEHYLITHMLRLVLEDEGFEVEERRDILTKVIRKQLLRGEIDLYWEYTGTGYRAHLRQNDPAVYTKGDVLYRTVKEMDRKHGVIWLKRAVFHNSFELAVTEAIAKQYQLEKLSDLAPLLTQSQWIFGIGKSFYVRPDGFLKLVQHYNWPVQNIRVKKMSYSVVYGALNRGQVTVGMVFTTDASAKHHRVHILQDDRSFFPIYNPAPILREETFRAYPNLVQRVNQIPPLLNQSTIVDLNYKVDYEQQSVEQVAQEWLKQTGVLE